ncbi:hypothetical protein DM02DRAFT_488490, partial [Periconia macrospinosa]
MAQPFTLNEQAVAHRLLVELLAHQFAFPVRWTDTQNALLSGDSPVSRLIELGPSGTLTGMAQKQATRLVTNGRRSAAASLASLTYTGDDPKLWYEYEPVVDEEAEGTEEPEVVAKEEAKADTKNDANEKIEEKAEGEKPLQVTLSIAAETSDLTAAVPDCPLPGSLVLRTLIARRLKWSLAQIPSSKCIRDLSGGKSIVQNEMVGDLIAEFGEQRVPDGAEDMALSELDSRLGSMANLGKISGTLVGRMVSNKMPVGCNAAFLRSHVATKWGLGPGRQSAVLVSALVSEPTGRLASTKEALDMIDDATQQYASWCGLALAVRDQQQQKQLQEQQQPAIVTVTVPANNHHPSSPTPDCDCASHVDELQAKLDALVTEFSSEYLDGALPVFDPRRVRRYNDWWNADRVRLATRDIA